jgi:O-antigen/teichoic acid export membrane protein
MGRPIRRTGLRLFAAGTIVAQVAALLRYTLLAWWLGPEQLGLAAMLVLTSQFFEQITDVGLDRFLIQSGAGNTRGAGAAVQLAVALRGLLIAGGIAVSSGLIAGFFHHPELRDGLLLLALAPAIQGFQHLDYRRVQRHHRFSGEGLMTIASETVSLIVLVTAALLLRSYVAIAIALIARAIATVVTSHLIARRRYRWGMPGPHRNTMLGFGLPLILNGLLLFLGSQGDRLIIGNQLGAKELGHYSAIILLILYPAATLSKLLQSIHLPTIAAARDDARVRARQIDRVAGEAVLLGIAMAAGFALVAPFVVPLIYGARFTAPALLIGATGILQSARFVRLWPATVSLAAGKSGNLLASSIVRLTTFPLAFLFAQWGYGLVGIVAGFVLGEFLASVASLTLLHRHGLGQPRHDWGRLALLALAFTGIALLVSGQVAAVLAGAAVSVVVVAWIAIGERDAVRALIGLAMRRAEPVLRRLRLA